MTNNLNSEIIFGSVWQPERLPFLDNVPSVKLKTFKQSKKQSNMWANLAVSVTSSLCVNNKASATVLLRTYNTYW